MADFAKAALNTWCSKKKLKVHYDIADVTKDTEGVPSFHCEVCVFTFSDFQFDFR